MHNLDIQVLSDAACWASEESIWLCTVLSTFGSSPRPPGTMMVIKADGQLTGSLSGGCVEENFTQRITRGEFSLDSQIVRYGDGGLEPDQSLPCGGVLDILIEHLPAGEPTLSYLNTMSDAVAGAMTLKKVIYLPEPCRDLRPCSYSSSTIAVYDDNRICLTLAAAPRIIVAGLSAVAVFCANFAVALGFETIVCENRDDALRNHELSLDQGVRLINTFPANYLEREGCHPHTAVVSLTHDPRMDDLTLMEAVNTPAFYIGAMGSERNSKRRLNRLREIAGLTAAQLDRINAPIGLQMASKTPAEIALSVMADIVCKKNGVVISE